MSRDPTMTALRDASPRNQPGFEGSIAHYDALRRRITACPVGVTAPSGDRPFPHLALRRRLIGLSLAAAAVATVVGVAIALTVGATSAANALAAARQALAATAGATSGTMTMIAVQGGATTTLETTSWHGSAVAFSSRTGILGPNRQLLLIGGGAYVQKADGRWLHYAKENGVGPKLGSAVQLAHDNVAGNTAEQVLALTKDVKRAARPDGTTVYTGTIPTTSAENVGNSPTDDAIVRLINNVRTDGNPPVSPNPYDRHPVHYRDVQLEMTVAADGLVKGISLTVQPTVRPSAVEASGVRYSQLGSTPAIAPPAVSTPTPPVSWSAGPACPPPPHGPCGG